MPTGAEVATDEEPAACDMIVSSCLVEVTHNDHGKADLAYQVGERSYRAALTLRYAFS